MGNINWQYVIDAAAALYGLYVFLSALKMKLTGEISSFLASPEELYKCKKKKEFAAEVQGRMMAFGVIGFLFGSSNIVNELLWQNKMFYIFTLGVFLLACGLFITVLRKAREKYLGL